jgi:hypothetical protein
LGYDGAAPAGYKFRVGNPSGQRLQWDGSQLDVVANTVSIGGTYFSSGSITNPSTGNLTIGATNTGAILTLGTNVSNNIIMNAYQFRPLTDGSGTSLGASGYRWNGLWVSLPDYSSGGTHTHDFVVVGKTDGSTGYAVGPTKTCGATIVVRNLA